MDPGNWATDLAGGSSYGYMLLFVILMSNLMAVVLQGLAVKLGVVSGLGTYSYSCPTMAVGQVVVLSRLVSLHWRRNIVDIWAFELIVE